MVGTFRQLACISISLLALSACGGGGGGSSSSAASAPPPVIPANSFLLTQPAGTLPAGPEVSFSFNGNTVAANGSDPTTQVMLGNSVTGHRTLALNITAGANPPIYSHTFDLSTAASTVFAPFVGIVDGPINADGSSPNSLVLDPTLTFSSYGLWVQNNSPAGGTGQTGALAFGQPTPVASIPNSGTADYAGRTIGGLVITGINSYTLTGTAQLHADFGTMRVTGSLTNMQAFLSAGSTFPWNNLALNSTAINAALPGGPYSGTVASTSASVLSPGPLNGTYNGNFYGPAFNETAGTWQVTGGTTTAFGAFGAKR